MADPQLDADPLHAALYARHRARLTRIAMCSARWPNSRSAPKPNTCPRIKASPTRSKPCAAQDVGICPERDCPGSVYCSTDNRATSERDRGVERHLSRGGCGRSRDRRRRVDARCTPHGHSRRALIFRRLVDDAPAIVSLDVARRIARLGWHVVVCLCRYPG